MHPRFEAIKFTPSEVPTPVPGQVYDLRLSDSTHGWAVLDHVDRRVAIFSRASFAMDSARRLNAGTMSAHGLMNLPAFYFHQLKKWSATHGQF